MTVFWVDIHPTFQTGFEPRILRAAGCVAMLCKVTEGNGWYREGYHTIRNKARRENIGFAAYHFLRSESSGASQANWTRQKMGSDWGTVPVMLDWETSVANTWAEERTARDYVNSARAAGGIVRMNYLPRWYWDRIGRPNLSLPPFNSLALVQSSYGSNPRGSITELYPGDTSARWASYAGLPFPVLQFGSRCRIPGWGGDLDINAYRGTEKQLRQTGWFHWPGQETPMVDFNSVSNIPDDLPEHFPPDVPITANAELSLEALLWRAILYPLQVRYNQSLERQEIADLSDRITRLTEVMAAATADITEIKRLLTESGNGDPASAAIIEAIKADGERTRSEAPDAVITALRRGTGEA